MRGNQGEKKLSRSTAMMPGLIDAGKALEGG
jgi:hypothetical protein